MNRHLRSSALALLLAACGDAPGTPQAPDAPDAAVTDTDASGSWADAAMVADATLPAGADAALPPGADAAVDPQTDAGGLPACTPYPATPLTGMWASAAGLSGKQLRDALYEVVRGHHSGGYDSAKISMYGPQGFDVIGGTVECIYSGQQFAPEMLDKTKGFNVEHSWPQSDGAEGVAKSDMHHLFPSEQKINSSRGNMDFGETDCGASKCRIDHDSGTQIGPRVGGSEEVCEVRPERRGDIARAHFYFAVRYQRSIPETELERLVQWNRCDPPDDQERARNDAIEKLQKNRNPFVDHPEFGDRITAY